MYLFRWYPIPTIFFFSIAPLLGGLVGYSNAKEGDERKKAMIGAGIGLLIDLPFLCLAFLFFSFA